MLRRGAGTSLTQVVKRRQGRRVVPVEGRATSGEAAEQPYLVHGARRNGVLRDRLNGLTRKSHAFAKDSDTWDAAFTLALFEHNWLRPHPALWVPLEGPCQGRRYWRRTPAMAIGLTDHVWTFHDFLTFPIYPR